MFHNKLIVAYRKYRKHPINVSCMRDGQSGDIFSQHNPVEFLGVNGYEVHVQKLRAHLVLGSLEVCKLGI